MSEMNQDEPVATEPAQENQPIQPVQAQPSTSIKAVVVSETCGYCQSLKDRLQQKGLLEKVQFIDVDSEEGRKIAEENNLSGVPECVVLLEKDGVKQTRVCNDEEFKKLLEEGQ